MALEKRQQKTGLIRLSTVCAKRERKTFPSIITLTFAHFALLTRSIPPIRRLLLEEKINFVSLKMMLGN
jgi:hypothetical protein